MSYAKKSNSQFLTASEHSHQQSPIEWWFAQGYYEGEKTGRRYFMTSFFRHDVSTNKVAGEDGYSLLLAVLDPDAERHESLSRIDQRLFNRFGHAGKNEKRTKLDWTVGNIYLSEIKAGGPVYPVQLESADVVMAPEPLKISWKDFSLSQADEGFSLSFDEPEGRRNCRFFLKAVQPRIFFEEKNSGGFEAMAYASHPMLELSGSVSGENVSGQAWLDHQWGDYSGWFVDFSREGKMLGWDWFGINLDDGTEIMLQIRRSMENLKALDAICIFRRKGGEPSREEHIVAEPLRYWQSPATHIKYPVEWRIKVKGIDADLNFKPLVDDQEISTFGLSRAIWEGVGRIEGKIGGVTASGRARMELFGYGFIFDFKSYCNCLIADFDQHLEDFFPKRLTTAKLQEYLGAPQWRHDPQAHTETLSLPLWDLMSRKGKRWRPLFGLLLLESLGVSSGPYLSLISTIPELAHNGALIVDDIEDGSKKRRGGQSIHLRYGLDVSLNAANTVYYLPYLLFATHPRLSDIQRLELYKSMIKHAVRAHFGQGLDIYWSANMNARNLKNWITDATGEKILQMYAYKTSAVVEELAESACIIASSSDERMEICRDFSRVFGVAFQIMDDVHNFSRSKKWTKTCGEDILSGKLTYVIFRALQLLNGSKRSRLQAILCSGSKKAALLKEAIDLIYDSGSIEICRKKAKNMFSKGWAAFSKKLPNTEAKIMLRVLCEGLLNIDFSSSEEHLRTNPKKP